MFNNSTNSEYCRLRKVQLAVWTGPMVHAGCIETKANNIRGIINDVVLFLFSQIANAEKMAVISHKLYENLTLFSSACCAAS